MAAVSLKLIKKYNVQGPRYTSYPTAVKFKEADEQHVQNLKEYLTFRNAKAKPISLYFHIPFCFSLCWYCGCTKIITKDVNRGDAYLDYLDKEMKRIKPLMNPHSKVVQIHFGGGTPTFLQPDQLRRLGSLIKSHFRVEEKTEFSVEIDPRNCTKEHVAALRDIGCNRVSLGVQDTNEEVQKAIHRIQPFAQTRQLTEWLREAGINSINYDLIYGLPKQNVNTFLQTMDDVLSLAPDRLAVYSYAHIPSSMPSQKLLNEQDLPSMDEKLGMLQFSIEHLTENGFRFIGMDHFSREGEELSTAEKDGSLQRNFQGYSTLAGADLYAFGMSGISNVGSWYWQNSKDLPHFYTMLDNDVWPVHKVLTLQKDDLLRKDVIMKIMCRMGLNYQEISDKWNIQFNEYFADEIKSLQKMQDDGLLLLRQEGFKITETGRLFLRNIAMCFDYYLKNSIQPNGYSKTV